MSNGNELLFKSNCPITESKTLLGQYCLAGIITNILPIPLWRGVCLPDSCSITDLKNIYAVDNITIVEADVLCQTQNYATEIDTVAWITIFFFGIIIFLMAVSTAYHIVVEQYQKGSPNSVLGAFSVVKNSRKMFTITKNSNQISCMNGIRTISIAWIILGHMYQVRAVLPLQNSFPLLKSLLNHEFDILMGGSKAVDAFLAVTGITLTNLFLTSAKNYKFNWLIFYFHRYLRLTPVLAALILFTVGVVKYLGSGPFWPLFAYVLVTPCKSGWWKTVLYINNYGDEQCILHSWYLSIDLQLYIISPFILLLLRRKPFFGVSLTVFLAAAVTVVSVVLTWFNDIDSNGIYSINDNYVKLYYKKTYTRATPWLIGILTGFIIYTTQHRKTKFVLKYGLVLFFWLISLTVLVFNSFWYIESFTFDESTKIKNSFFNGFMRSLWGAAIGWIIFACHFGYGGVVNWFLSLPVFQILTRLQYSAYLVHLTIVSMVLVNIRSAVYMTNPQMFLSFWGIFMFTQLVALFFSLAFESPIIALERILLERKTEQKLPV